MRENVGFIIVAAKDFQDFEIVLGYNPKTHQYVTWKYDALGGYNYGYYTSHFLKAVEDYKDRIRKEEEYIC